MTDWNSIRDAIDQAMRPAHFFVGQAIGLEWQHQRSEETRWEAFQGRLLAPAHTRQQRIFESWHLWQLDSTGRSGEPLLSVKLDAAERQVHVVRAILTHGWEAYDSGGNVIDSRPAQKWVRELVGSINLADFSDPGDQADELATLLYQAVVGTSRLALTSLEAPLPAFSLGQLAYFHQSGATDRAPMRTSADLLDRALPAAKTLPARAKVVETILRSAGDAPAMPWLNSELLLAVFNDVSLSPWTDFVPRALALAARLKPTEQIQFLSRLLRRLCRHLSAFDLVLFHHRGANYPDALLLDAALKQFIQVIDQPADPLTRRALRQAWLLRRHYEGHPVPEAPTSEGENVRVLPSPYQRVPDEQIMDPKQRQRRLFAGDPLELSSRAQRLLTLSFDDLDDPTELQELGTALYLDRPLGIFKRPGEPDGTPLLSYVTFSRTLARRRLRELHELGAISSERSAVLQERLEVSKVRGISLEPAAARPRPGAASLADAHQVAGDFQLLKTTPRSLADFLAAVDLSAVLDFTPLLIVGGAVLAGGRPEVLTFLDAEYQPRLQLTFEAEMACRAGREFPRKGLRLVPRADQPGKANLLLPG